MAGQKDLRFLLTAKQKAGVTLRKFINISNAQEEMMRLEDKEIMDSLRTKEPKHQKSISS